MFEGKMRGRGGHHGGGRRFGKPVDADWTDEDGFDAGGRGRRRMFDGGSLRLVLLKLIADTPRHGYDLIRAIEERTGGAYAPSPGVIYPTLTLLAEMGLVAEQATEGARKLFGVTEAGRAHLVERAGEVEPLFARLDSIGEMQGRAEIAPARRAIHNLRNVLRHRLAAGLDTEKLHQAVALIDEVAGKIERL